MFKKAPKDAIHVGIGFSRNKNGEEAAEEATLAALKDCKGKSTFSIVYVDDKIDPHKVLKSLNKHLGRHWVGISVDKMFNDKMGYDENATISVMCLNSDYIHFGIGVADNYRKHPHKSAKKATKHAFKTVKADDHIDAYVQFIRAKKHDYSRIVKTPPYFILAFLSGVKVVNGKENPGEEAEFVSGIVDYVGPHVPVFGGSASSDLNQYLQGKADNFQFANGKLYYGAAIVVFAISDLYFEIHSEHGYDMTKRFALVTKLDKKGYEIQELNHNEPVEEYAKLLGLTKDTYLKNFGDYMFKEPFGIVRDEGRSTIKEVLPHPNQKSLQSNFKLQENAVLNVLEYNKKKTLHTMDNIFKKTNRHRSVALGLFCVCSGRRPLLNGQENKEIARIQKHKLPFFGFFSFGEIGSTENAPAESHSQTVTALIINNTLLTE